MTTTPHKKVLIVDDEPDVITYLSAFFEDNGFAVSSAANGKEAFEKALSQAPDVITLDITMPEESGVRAYRDLQENKITSNIPVIIVTGIASDFKTFIQSRKQVKPPAAYFEKPIDRDALLAKVKELLGI